MNKQVQNYGVESLTDNQLIAEILGSELATALFGSYEGLSDILRKDFKQISYDTGISNSDASKVKMLFHFSQRVQEAELGYDIKISSPVDAVAFFGPKLRYLTKEVFIVAFLNNAKRLTEWETISSGGSTATIVDPAEVLRQSIVSEANSIILAHNHPSGSEKESRADIQLTKRIAESGEMLGIPVDDHIIIAGDSFTSLKAKGLLK